MAEVRKAKGAVPIFHSCDPCNTEMLTHYKRGSFMSRTGYEPDYPTKQVLIPRRYGKTERVLRCAKGPAGCTECENTGMDGGGCEFRPEAHADGLKSKPLGFESTDLSLQVAKSHNIRGAYIRPSSSARKVAERLKDATKRGRWMHSLTMATPSEDVTKRIPSFDSHAENLHGVTDWLYNTPRTIEAANSTPVIIENGRIPYPQQFFDIFEDDLLVGAVWQSLKAESLYRDFYVQALTSTQFIDIPRNGKRLWADAGTTAQARRVKLMTGQRELIVS